jgi:glycerophosphoryl diester phosphodiesterase
MAAFRRAVELGVDMIELDVRRTADGHLVVFHDDTLNRITGTDGTIESRTLAELSVLDAGSWFSPTFAGERIPPFEAVLELVAGRVALDVEVKVPQDKSHLTELVEAVATTLSAWHTRVSLLASSFGDDVVRGLRSLLPGIPVCRIYGPNETIRADFGPQHPYAILHGRLLTPEVVHHVHHAGAKVLVWTLDEEAHMDAAFKAGVDGICSNHPARLLAARQRWSAP